MSSLRITSNLHLESPVKKAKMSKAQKPGEKKPAHPKTSAMVNTAIQDLADRGGSSLASIKKYISNKYDLDFEKKTAYYIKKYLKQAVIDGILVQTKGKGANGSFKLPSAALLAARRREAKALKGPSKRENTEKPTFIKKSSAEKTSPVTKKASTKASPVKKKASTKTSLAKTEASTKTAVKTSIDDGKPKPAKPAVNKTVSKSPKAKKITRTPTNKPKAPRPKKFIPASKSPEPAAKNNVATKSM